MVGVANRRYVELVSLAEAARHLEISRAEVIRELTRFESHEAAEDEFARSLDTLRNIHREQVHLRATPVESIAVFLPVNLPLYSLILFAAIPSLMADTVRVRAPAATPQWYERVASLAGFREHFPRVRLVAASRREFVEQTASRADVVVFTGRHENALHVRSACPDALFIFEGSGPNPIVIGPAVNLAADLDRILTPRLFNGGQDCAGPDAYLVHRDVREDFVRRTTAVLQALPRGDYRNPSVRVGRVLDPGPLAELTQWLGRVQSATLFGGKVDRAARYVEPTLVCRDIRDGGEMPEFFAPVFNVLEYQTDDELAEFLAAPRYADHAMYVSFFGQRPPYAAYEASTVLLDRTVLEVERGNDPYGGFGPKANYVARGENVLEVSPILISAVIARHGRREGG